MSGAQQGWSMIFISRISVIWRALFLPERSSERQQRLRVNGDCLVISRPWWNDYFRVRLCMCPGRSKGPGLIVWEMSLGWNRDQAITLEKKEKRRGGGGRQGEELNKKGKESLWRDLNTFNNHKFVTVKSVSNNLAQLPSGRNMLALFPCHNFYCPYFFFLIKGFFIKHSHVKCDLNVVTLAKKKKAMLIV